MFDAARKGGNTSDPGAYDAGKRKTRVSVSLPVNMCWITEAHRHQYCILPEHLEVETKDFIADTNERELYMWESVTCK
jgi:hypothetical protein